MRITTVCLAWLATPLWGQAGLPQVAFEKHTLPNGLQVILHVDRKLPVVNVNIWYHVTAATFPPWRC